MEKIDIKKIAREILISLSPEEEKEFMQEFAYFIEQFKKLESLPHVDEVSPMFFPIKEERDFLREDEPETLPSTKEILGNSKNMKDTFIVIPKVVK